MAEENTGQTQAVGRAKGYANLIPWKAGGPSPNPGGRPKKKLVVQMLEEELEELAEGQGMDREDATRLVAKKWATMILRDGDYRALKEFLDRRDGSVKQELGVKYDVAETLARFYTKVMRPAELAEPEPAEPDAH